MTKLVVGPGEKDNVEFGNMLERFRREAGFTRARAANAFGFSSEYIRMIERGKRTPVAGNMRRMLNVYGVDAVERIQDQRVIIGDIDVEFTSRILEARHPELPQPQRPRMMKVKRAKKIGRIVELLMQADDETLDAVIDVLVTTN